MRALIDIIKRITFLSAIPTVMISLPCFLLVAYVLLLGKEQSILAYIAYVLSAYAMVISSTLMYRVVMQLKQDITNHRLWKYYKSDAVLRTEVALALSGVLNGLYAVGNIASVLMYQSFWFLALAIYYLILFMLQIDLLRYIENMFVEQCQMDELKKVRLYGGLLLVTDLILAVIVFFMVCWDRGYQYPGVMIYVMALHAFAAFGIAIWNLIKYRKLGNPILMTAKVLSLTSALVSILALETAMLSAFSSINDLKSQQLMTGLTGAGVCTIIFGMAVFMIIYSNRLIRAHKNNDK